MAADFNVDEWLLLLLRKLNEAFGDRLIFAAHAGSWVRSEAGPASDIDLNIVLDRAGFDDILTWRRIPREMSFS